MSAPPKEGPCFNPQQTRELGRALDLAIIAASGDAGTLAMIPARDLRHRLACLIIAQATRAPLSAETLAAQAVDGLRVVADHTTMIGRFRPPRRAQHVR